MSSFRFKHRGFTLIEIGIVSIVLVVLLVLSVPKIQEIIFAGRVAGAGKDIIAAITRLQESAIVANSTTPFGLIPSSERLFAGSNFQVSGSTVFHGLGYPLGDIQVTGIAAGSAAAITVWGLSTVACPSLAFALNKSVAAIEISTSGIASLPTAPVVPTVLPSSLSSTVVKVATVPFDPFLVRSACGTETSTYYIHFYIN